MYICMSVGIDSYLTGAGAIERRASATSLGDRRSSTASSEADRRESASFTTIGDRRLSETIPPKLHSQDSRLHAFDSSWAEVQAVTCMCKASGNTPSCHTVHTCLYIVARWINAVLEEDVVNDVVTVRLRQVRIVFWS